MPLSVLRTTVVVGNPKRGSRTLLLSQVDGLAIEEEEIVGRSAQRSGHLVADLIGGALE